MLDYQKAYLDSIANPEKFWAEAAKELKWFSSYDKVLEDKNKPIYSWFTGGKFNISYNALDRHVEDGYADKLALIYDSPVTGRKQKYTYAELTDKVGRFAGILQSIGVSAGDRVIIYMPMIPEAVMAMLATARIGAIHSVVFGGFAAKELAKRIDDAKADFIISASCGIEVSRIVQYKTILDEAIELASYKPKKNLIYQRKELPVELNSRDIDFEKAMETAEFVEPVALDSEAPLYILYTSGTTGYPKGILRTQASQAVALKWSMSNIYGADRSDIYWAASDIGWVVGHSYIVYAPLLHGCTTILYEGKPVGTPDAGAFWRMIDEYKINILFTAPTSIRVIKQQDPDGKFLQKYDTSSLKSLFLAGERSDPDTILWAERYLKVPVIDHWWQTETSWAIVAKPLGMQGSKEKPIKLGSASFPVPGYDVRILDESGREVKPNEHGNIVVKLPLPPGTLLSLWGKDDDYKSQYLSEYPGYYLSGDAGYKDEDGYIFVMGRIDDVINVAGHRLSTGAIEEILTNHPMVAEAAVIARHDSVKGEIPVGLVVLNANAKIDKSTLADELIASVRKELGPVAAFKSVTSIEKLPKTRSGKVLRSMMRKIAKGEPYSVPPTIEDPSVVDIVIDRLKELANE